MARSSWGSLRPKSKGVWELRYTVGSHQRSETIRGTKKQAERRLSELRIKYENKLTMPTTTQFWKNWYVSYMDSTLAPQTRSEYRRTWSNDIQPIFGDLLLYEITPRMVQDWLTPMTKSKAKHCKACLSSILSRAFALDFIDDNVAQRRYVMPTTTGRSRSMDTYTLPEMVEIFNACHGEIWEPAFILAAFGGASREESMSPRLSEIQFDAEGNATVPILRGIQRLDGKIVVTEKLKNKYRERNIVIVPPFSYRLREIVYDYMNRGYIWLMDDGMGNVLCPNNVCQGTYKRWFIGKPYRYVTFGNLRKSFATSMVANGMDGLAIANILGHSQLTTTHQHYNNLQEDQKKKLLQNTYGTIRDKKGSSHNFCNKNHWDESLNW